VFSVPYISGLTKAVHYLFNILGTAIIGGNTFFAVIDENLNGKTIFLRNSQSDQRFTTFAISADGSSSVSYNSPGGYIAPSNTNAPKGFGFSNFVIHEESQTLVLFKFDATGSLAMDLNGQFKVPVPKKWETGFLTAKLGNTHYVDVNINYDITFFRDAFFSLERVQTNRAFPANAGVALGTFLKIRGFKTKNSNFGVLKKREDEGENNNNYRV